MRLSPGKFDGVTVIDIERKGDARGHFARLFCERELAQNGIEFRAVQTNLSYNAQALTLRGMHYQDLSVPEPKIVRCLRGEIFDVAVDLRPRSPSFGQWHGERLSAENGRALYIAPGLAHGFLSLTDETEILYHMGGFYAAELARAVRWNDPHLGIVWPDAPAVVSDRDAAAPLMAELFPERFADG